MATTRRVRKKTAYHHGDLRRTLIDAALKLVEEHGPSAITLREAARMAGVSHQAPYRHFANRCELIAAVAGEGFRELHTQVLEKTRAAKDPKEALSAIASTYVLFAVEHPAHFRVMYSTEAAGFIASRPALQASTDMVCGLLIETIIELKRGTAGEGDPLELALTAWALVHGLASLLVEGQLHRRAYSNRTPRDLTEIVTRVLWQGLGALVGG